MKRGHLPRLVVSRIGGWTSGRATGDTPIFPIKWPSRRLSGRHLSSIPTLPTNFLLRRHRPMTGTATRAIAEPLGSGSSYSRSKPPSRRSAAARCLREAGDATAIESAATVGEIIMRKPLPSGVPSSCHSFPNSFPPPDANHAFNSAFRPSLPIEACKKAASIFPTRHNRRDARARCRFAGRTPWTYGCDAIARVPHPPHAA